MEKPKVKLSPLERTAVLVPTQEQATELMRVYECGDWLWTTGYLPTNCDFWKRYLNRSCVRVENEFGYSNKEFYDKEGMKILEYEDFYKTQPELTLEKRKEINDYFEKIGGNK